MPTEALPFNASQDTGLEQLGGAAPYSINALVDGTGTIRMRPGISAWSDFPTTVPVASPVLAMVPYGSRLVYITEGRKLYSCEGSGVVSELSSSTTTTQLAGVKKPQMLATSAGVTAVGGGAAQTWAAGSLLSSRLSGSPPNATHIANLATRLILGVNNDSGTFRWSGLGTSGHTSWDALNYAEAEARGDRLNAITDNTNELYAFGAETLQVFTPDPVVGFAAGRALNLGMTAPYSAIRGDDDILFLERQRRFVATDGRGWQEISPGLGRTLEEMDTVDDCWGFRAALDQWDLYTWFFPTENRAFMWDRGSNKWGEWRTFGTSGWSTPSITSCVAWPEQNVTLVGLSTGQIAKLDTAAYSDLGDIIKVEVVTGFVDHGTQNRKHCAGVNFKFKRGQTAQSGTAPRVFISWRDDMGAWESPEMFDLGLAGDYDPTITVRSLGIYRQRQWKLEFTTASELAFVGATEDFTVLSN